MQTLTLYQNADYANLKGTCKWTTTLSQPQAIYLQADGADTGALAGSVTISNFVSGAETTLDWAFDLQLDDVDTITSVSSRLKVIHASGEVEIVPFDTPTRIEVVR